MTRLTHIFASLFASNRLAPAHAARALLERATRARGQSVHEAAMLRANAQAVLSVLR